MKRLLLIPLFVAVAGAVFFVPKLLDHRNVMKVGVVVPLEHEAMRAIVSGYREELEAAFGKQVKVKVQNAQGDPTLLQTIVDSYERRGYDIIAPIGTNTTRMVLQRTRAPAIVGLDVLSSVGGDSERVTGVVELDLDPSLRLIHQLFPRLRKVTLLHSMAENMGRQAAAFMERAQAEGIEVQELSVQSLSDLYTVSRAIATDSGLLVILKDHLVVSGITSVARAAEERGIPLMTSDEGSVRNGGGLTVGNRERDIGRQGGSVSVRILCGEAPGEIRMEPVRDVVVFINGRALEGQGLGVEAVKKGAQQLGYQVEEVDVPAARP